MARYIITKLPGKREGFAIFDREANGTVAGTRCTTKRECYEAARDLGIEIGK